MGVATVAFVCWILGALWSLLWDLWTYRVHAQAAMNHDPDNAGHEQIVREARTLLALKGHRMTKRTRDALAVWLAEQEQQ